MCGAMVSDNSESAIQLAAHNRNENRPAIGNAAFFRAQKREKKKKIDRQEIDILCCSADSRNYITKSPNRVAFHVRRHKKEYINIYIYICIKK